MQSLDNWLSAAGSALRTLSGSVTAARLSPAVGTAEMQHVSLSEAERREAGALMRIDHVGEVCAQALYQAQGLMARSDTVRAQLAEAAKEEEDHLAWTQERLQQLGAHRSRLNPVWYAGAFLIGALAGRMSDRTSLAFVVETERQVERHLEDHLQRWPLGDGPSRSIVAQMKADEGRHADQAEAAGADCLPLPARWLMRAAARVMTITAHRI